MKKRTYPTLFRLANLVVRGPGFSAGVGVEGRALAELREEDRWGLYVLAADLEGTGGSLDEAFASLRSRFLAALFDLADGSRSCREFARRAGSRFPDPAGTDRRWEDALGAVSPSGPPLAREAWPRDRAVVLRVQCLDAPRASAPAANQVDALILLDRRSPQRAVRPAAERRMGMD